MWLPVPQRGQTITLHSVCADLQCLSTHTNAKTSNQRRARNQNKLVIKKKYKYMGGVQRRQRTHPYKFLATDVATRCGDLEITIDYFRFVQSLGFCSLYWKLQVGTGLLSSLDFITHLCRKRYVYCDKNGNGCSFWL